MFDFGFYVIGDGNDVRGRLPHYVEQHGRTSIRSDDGEARLESGRDAGDVADAHRNVVDARHDDRGEIVDRRRLTADESQLELMIFVDEARRGDHVRALHRIRNLLQRDAARFEAGAIDEHVIFAQLTAEDLDAGHAVDPRQRRTKRYLGEIA